MPLTLSTLVTLSLLACAASAGPVVFQDEGKRKYFDVQGHRGSRGETVESTLPAFAWGLLDGVTTLEFDNGISKDGAVIVWHDEIFTPDKCQDTKPAKPNDPDFPYIGKHLANLTLAQIKTLDCGSKRLSGFPLALTYPGTKLSTLDELFAFARCVDPERTLNFNIESKINPVETNSTRGVEDFVQNQYKAFIKSGYPLSQITYQSFDWRTLIRMKQVDPKVPTAALIDDSTKYGPDNSVSPWLGGVDLASQPGDSLGAKIAHGAKSIKADIVSAAAVSSDSKATDPADAGYLAFTTKEMITAAHNLGLLVKPWTVNRLNIVDQLLEWGTDGIITDYPEQVRRYAEYKGKKVSPKFSSERVHKCLKL